MGWPHVYSLAGIFLMAGGFYGVFNTFSRSGRIHPDTGAKLLLLYALVVFAGGYLIVEAVYP